MSAILDIALDLESFVLFGLPCCAFIIFIVLLRKFLSANEDKRKSPMILSGILSIVLLLASFVHWISYDFASDTVFLAKILFILWLIVTYIFMFLLYNLTFTIPITEILWFIVMLVKYLGTQPDSGQKQDRKIEMFVSGGIALLHTLIVLVLTKIFL